MNMKDKLYSLLRLICLLLILPLAAGAAPVETDSVATLRTGSTTRSVLLRCRSV